MNDLLARVRVLAGAAVTYLVALGAILAIIVDELAPFADDPAVAWVLRILGILATVVAVSVAIVRRVTPVLPSERGLLPPPAPGARPLDAGRVALENVLVVLAIVVLAIVLIRLVA